MVLAKEKTTNIVLAARNVFKNIYIIYSFFFPKGYNKYSKKPGDISTLKLT